MRFPNTAFYHPKALMSYCITEIGCFTSLGELANRQNNAELAKYNPVNSLQTTNPAKYCRIYCFDGALAVLLPKSAKYCWIWISKK
jgi:hypothetical protein